MTVERLYVAASGLSLVMKNFQVMGNDRLKKEPDSNKKNEEEAKIRELQKGKEKQTEKKKHNIPNRAA